MGPLTGRGMGKPGFPTFQPLSGRLALGRDRGNPAAPEL